MNNTLHKDFKFDVMNIGSKEIRDFVNFYKIQLKEKIEKNYELDFSIGDIVSSIDELLYAYILLFVNDFPNSVIIFNFPQKNKVSSIAIQQIGYLNLYKNEKTKIIVTEQGVLTTDFITASKDFFPFLLINKNTCGDLESENDFFIERSLSVSNFISGLTTSKITTLKNCFSEKEEFLKQIKLAQINKPINILHLSWHYLLNTLSQLNVLRYYFDKKHDTGKKFRAGNLPQEWSDRLIRKIVSTLEDQGYFKFSYISIFIFNLLVENSKKLIITSIQKGSNEFIENYNKNIIYLLKETNDIVSGLEELAKNIVEHTGKTGIDSGFGIISARVHKKEKAEILKDNTLEKWCKDKVGKSEQSLLLLDINVIDSGLESVSTKYKQNLQSEINKYSQNKIEPYPLLKRELENDLTKINNEKYTFSRFLNYQEIELQHQIKRANARLGLLIFSNLVIEKKSGIIKISSTDLNSNDPDFAYLSQENKKFKVDKSLINDGINILGTNYNFIIPIEYNEKRTEDTKLEGDKGTPTSTLKALFNYEIIDYKEVSNLDNNKITYMVKDIPTVDVSGKYEKIYAYSESIRNTIEKQKNTIVLIDAQKVRNVLLNSSDWIRLLACVQFSTDIQLIIFNIDFKIQQEIISINKIYDSINQFWNNSNFTLFYIKYNYVFEHRRKVNDKKQEVSLWLCDVLNGKTFNEYLSLNKSISHYHHNLFSIIDHEIELTENISINIRKNNKLFSKDGKLLNFELLIKPNGDLTLFEESVQSLLGIEICTLSDYNLSQDNVEKKEKFFYKFKGYKVSNSHFKLGSKIHINDFYYAKRIFYNSFYANRFAFLVAKYILNELINNFSKDKEISLIGYSRYSELLVSNTRRLLEEQGYIKINHDIILEDNRVLKNARKINKDVIIIVPISSTFSTSDKIKKWLDNILKKHGQKNHHSIIKTDINILLVADKNFYKFDVNGLYKEFGWVKWKDDEFYLKTLEKKESDNTQISYQKYFISLTTDWQAIHECKFCFPNIEKEENEKCLLETGVNSVSPESIFGFPISRPKNVNEKLTFESYISKSDRPVVLQRHIKRDDKHYKQYIKVGSFLNKNKQIVKNWLIELSKRNIFDNINSNIVIITPSRTSNSGFVNMVNEYLLSDTATVLQYSTTDDILQNFISFNASFFYNSKVIFVDDVLHTAHSFHLINDYIKSIPFKNGNQKSIDHCFCIINRLGYFDEQNVLNNLTKEESSNDKIFSFVELDIPSIKQTNYEFPDVIKGNLFNELANSSVLDMMKLHFSELRENVKAYDVDYISKEPSSEYIHLFNFLVYKALYSFFEGQFKNSPEFHYNNRIDLFVEDNKSQILEVLYEYVNKDKDLNDFLKDSRGKIFKFEVETRIIYICASPPFSYYKDIKESAFSWIKTKLEYFQNKIIDNESNEQFISDFLKCKKLDNDKQKELPTIYCEYQTFKLYLRLAVELKSNYIFSIKMFKAIGIIINQLSSENRFRYSYNDIIINTVNTQTSFSFEQDEPDYFLTPKKEKIISPIGFITYYTGLIQQLIFKDEAKAIKLIQNIVEFIRVEKIHSKDERVYLSLRNDFDNEFINLLRILVLENTFIFDTFQKTFHEEKSDLNRFTFEKHETNGFKFTDFQVELDNYNGQAARTQALNKMLFKYSFTGSELNEVEKELENAFQKTIYLKTLLKNELQNKHNGGDVQQKVSIILEYLSEILDISKDKCNGGAFFTMRYKNLDKTEDLIDSDDLYTISNYSTSDDERIKSNVTSTNSLVFELYRGIKEKGSKKPNSTLEILYNEHLGKFISSKIEKFSNIDNDIDVNDKYIETAHDQKYYNMFFMRFADIKEDTSHIGILDILIHNLNTSNNFDKNLFISELSKIDIELRDFIWKKINNLIERAQQNNEETNVDLISKLKSSLLDIKNKISFKTNPLAVLCFYKCNLKNKKECKLCKESFCNNNAIKNKRFDPKRLRFLLLLRDDINEFINYNLTNDSFRAFVEKEQKGEYMFSLSHGIETYERMIKSYIIKLQESNDPEIIDGLETAIFYLTNKLHLISNATKLKSGELTFQDISNINTIGQFINVIETRYKTILTFENELYPKIDLKHVLFDFKQINSELFSTEFPYPQALLIEIAFEIIYNIRKYVIGRANNISLENKLIISLDLKESNNILYFGIINNHSNRKQSSIDRLNEKFRNKPVGINGLDLIYNCLYVLFERESIYSEIESDNNSKYFKIWIPLKKIQ
ncbi:MAG: hypothetical protein PHG47_11325 [Sulfuricella sp.]|nr:hypothetical protein [Sulfuricella sp.]